MPSESECRTVDQSSSRRRTADDPAPTTDAILGPASCRPGPPGPCGRAAPKAKLSKLRRSADRCPTRSARMPDAPSPNCQLPKLHCGRPLGAGAETKTTTDDSTSPRAVTPRPRTACARAEAQKPNRFTAYLRDLLRTCVIPLSLSLSLSLSTYKFSIMYV